MVIKRFYPLFNSGRIGKMDVNATITAAINEKFIFVGICFNHSPYPKINAPSKISKRP